MKGSSMGGSQKRRNLKPKPQVKGRRKLLTDSNTRLMISEMRKKEAPNTKGCFAGNYQKCKRMGC